MSAVEGSVALRMARDRVEELAEAGVHTATVYCGPANTGLRFCRYGEPTSLEECGFLNDTSLWIYERIQVEPDWRIRQAECGNWQVWAEDGQPFTRYQVPQWNSETIARAYLHLLRADFWCKRYDRRECVDTDLHV